TAPALVAPSADKPMANVQATTILFIETSSESLFVVPRADFPGGREPPRSLRRNRPRAASTPDDSLRQPAVVVCGNCANPSSTARRLSRTFWPGITDTGRLLLRPDAAN